MAYCIGFMNGSVPLVLCALAGIQAQVAGQSRPAVDVEIRLASNSALEQRGREQLQRLLETYDLRPWLFTRTIQIQSHVIPHSHPVLTLNTRYVDNDTAQVATFIHEQLHWLLVARAAAVDSAIADLRHMYPHVPADPPRGARGEESTYLHLLICMLEFDGVRQVFGASVARRTLERWDHYTWVYRQVLEHPGPLRRILEARGLFIPSTG